MLDLGRCQYLCRAGWLQAVGAVAAIAAVALVALGGLCMRQARWDEASRHLQAAIRLQPSNGEARLLLGRWYLEHSDRESARQQYEVLQRIDARRAEELRALLHSRRLSRLVLLFRDGVRAEVRRSHSLKCWRRDDALLASIESLVLSTPQRRSLAAMLVADDYPLLRASLPGTASGELVFDPENRLLSSIEK